MARIDHGLLQFSLTIDGFPLRNVDNSVLHVNPVPIWLKAALSEETKLAE